MSGWGMGSWFGGGGGASSKKKDAPKNAILQLRSTLDMLTKREKHIQNQMDEEDAKARKFVSTNKAGKYITLGSQEEEARSSGRNSGWPLITPSDRLSLTVVTM